jgi:cell wall-associated NlpC family hydrolase
MIPGRAEPSDRSEMGSQLLLGEHFTIIEVLPKWVKIMHAWDSYICWIGSKQYEAITNEQFIQLEQNKPIMVADIAQVMTNTEDKQAIPIVLGSVLPSYTKPAFNIGNQCFNYDGAIQNNNPSNVRNAIVESAYLFLNAPYLWGGKTPFGIDCSGLTQMAYKLNGIKLSRDAYMQAQMGMPLSFIEESRPGDLAFFDNEEGKIIHVGIILQHNKIIHASGKVRIDVLDHHGIFNANTKGYTHKLRVIKNLLDD